MKYGVISSLMLSLTLSVHAQTVSEQLTTVADKGTSGMYIAKLCPDHDVSVDKNVGDAYSIYVDLGIPYLNKLRVRGGMYHVKAGESVIMSSVEPSTFEVIAAEDVKSSLFSNDVICPAEDMPTADFIAQHPVNDGEYIYMLTNMERNGGFGFTYFNGDTMRKGSFFIVSTVEPETTGIHNIKSNAATDERIFDLQGREVSNPLAGHIYISGGRKFIYGAAAHPATISSEPVTRAKAHTRADIALEDGDAVPFLPGEAGNDDGF